MRVKGLLFVLVTSVAIIASSQLPPTGTTVWPTSARQHRTTEATKTSEVIQRVVQAAIQSASSRRAYRNRTRQATTTTRPLYHSSYKNSSGVIHTLPTVRGDRAVPNISSSETTSGPAQQVLRYVGATPPTRSPARHRKYSRKLSGTAAMFSHSTARTTATSQQSATAKLSAEASTINNNLALKILKRSNASDVNMPLTSNTTARDPSLALLDAPPTTNAVRNIKQDDRPNPRRYATGSSSPSTRDMYTSAPFHSGADRWQEYRRLQTTRQAKHVISGNITLNGSSVNIAHISPEALSAIATASTTDKVKLFSVTIQAKNSSSASYGPTERLLETASSPRITTPVLSTVTGSYEPTQDDMQPQKSNIIYANTTDTRNNIKLTTARIPVLSVKLNATRETYGVQPHKQSGTSANTNSTSLVAIPVVSADRALIGHGTTVEVSWKLSVTKSTTPSPKTNTIRATTLYSGVTNTEDFFKLLHDMTSSTYKHNITYSNYDGYHKYAPRKNTSDLSERAYGIPRAKQDGSKIEQVQYSGISNSVVISDIPGTTDEKDKITTSYTNKINSLFTNKMPSSTISLQTSSRPFTSSTQRNIQLKSTLRPSVAAPSPTRTARRQVFLFHTPTSANEIHKSSESKTSETTFGGSTGIVSRTTPTSPRASGDSKEPSASVGVRAANSSNSSRSSPAGSSGRRATTLPTETAGKFFGWLAAMQAPSRKRKSTRDAKEASIVEDKPQPSTLQRIFAAMQTVADALMEVPRQIWLLPIRFGLYPYMNRVQEEIPSLVRFPCAVSPPAAGAAPSSVHRLRPADIRVVAALGDSLTAASGALASSEEESRLSYRGVSAMAGGQAHWRKYLTLPNILKEFNPRLTGYSLNSAKPSGPLDGLNVAQEGALDDQLLQQAKLLVDKVRHDRFVDIDTDWKLVNILIGGNDICNEYCFVDGSKDTPSGHRRNLEVALDYLQTHLPRTFVNLIHVPNMVLLRNITNVPFSCYMKRLVMCSCLFGSGERAKAESVSQVLRGYWDVERKVASLERYDSDNFTVVLQPFFVGVRAPSSIPTVFGQAPDLSYFAPDCFHFSQKGNSLVANALWNNMLEPVGNKSYGWQPLMTKFRCPSEEAPYLFTGRNSRSFLETGHQEEPGPHLSRRGIHVASAGWS